MDIASEKEGTLQAAESGDTYSISDLFEIVNRLTVAFEIIRLLL